MTDDIPLERVRSFAALRSMLNRLHERAGRPGAGAIKRSTSAAPGLVSLSRNRVIRILRGTVRPSRDELRALLYAYGVPDSQRRRWDDAWARAAGERRLRPQPVNVPAQPRPASDEAHPAGTGSADGPAPHDPAGQDDPRAASARRMLEVRERCAQRLRRLKNELAASRAQTDLDDPAASTQLVRSLDFALRRLQDIIDEACTEVLADMPGTPATLAPASEVSRLSAAPGGPPADPMSTVDTAAPGGPPADSMSTVDAAAPGESADGPPDEPEDQALAWLAAVQEAVPPAIVANLLRVMRDVPMFNHIAQERPLLMAELLAVLEHDKAADWLQTWEPESAAETLAVADPARAAVYLTLIAPESAAALLVRVSHRRAVAILAEMRSEPAARLLMAMGPSAAAALLDRMERGAATIRLQLIDEIDPELAAKFLSLMSEDAASECLSRMDQEKAKRRQARDLLEGIGDQRPGHRR
jgi:flagellar motility protein MotE (MotC chaperone)